MSETLYGYCECGCGIKTNVHVWSDATRGHVKGESKRFAKGHQRRVSIAVRFWAKVDKSGECWEWIGGKNDKGYGTIIGEHGTLAHRASWVMANGPIPDGLCVLHKCDNPCCVNPSHLFLGTQDDNMADMVAKQRGRGLKGGMNVAAKLDESQVIKIRSMFPQTPRKEMAAAFGVSVDNVNCILRRASWKHI